MNDSESFIEKLLKLGIKREEIPKWSNEQEYMNILTAVTQNERVTKSIAAAQDSYWRNFNERVVKKYGKKYLEELRNEVRRIKEYSIEHLDELIKETMDNIRDNKGCCYLAKDAEEAREIIKDIVGDAKIIVKGKSITSEEIHLREYLEELGKDVFETDLGEFLVQVLGPKPMHLTSPALHIPRVKVAEMLKKLTGEEVDPDNIPEMVSIVRKFLREKFILAEVGISGANVIAADPGLIFLIENEGNIRLATALPEKHIVIAGIEKIVPTLYDAIKIIDATMKFCGYKTASYINIIGGPSKTGDIEKKVVYGAHGPREFHVVLLDNGRSKIAKDPILKEALYCIRCGACMYVCPVFRRVAGYWGGETYMGGIGAIWTAITEGFEKAYPLPLSCLYDLRCKEICPAKINHPKLIYTLARRLAK